MQVAGKETSQKQWVELQLLCRGQTGKNRILQSLMAFYQKLQPQLQQQALPLVPDSVLNIPRIIDLVQLYEEVVNKGGAVIVSKNQLWPSIVASMKLKIAPTQLEQLYTTWLAAFEQHKVFGKSGAQRRSYETIATHAEIQATTSIRYTPLPMVTKRLKTHRQQLTDLGVLHRLVLALDSNLPDHLEWALNQLTVLSYGNPKDSDCDVLFAHTPGLLDALCRQLESVSEKKSIQLFAQYTSIAEEQEHLLRVLNILRNLAMVRENEKQLTQHTILRQWLFKTLSPVASQSSCDVADDAEVRDFAMDIILQIGPSYQPRLNVDEWTCILAPLIMERPRRSQALKSLDLISLCLQNPTKPQLQNHKLFSLVLQRTVELLSRNRQDSLLIEDDGQDNAGMYDEDDDDVGDNDGGDELDGDLLPYLSSTRPWDSALSPTGGERIGANMGMIFVSRRDGANDEAKKGDFEVRDLALLNLFYLSESDDNIRLWIARQPSAMEKIAMLVACGRAETARLAIGVLANLTQNPATKPFFLPIESRLLKVATADANLSHLVVSIMAEAYTKP
ncbi:hypothetical protein THRCLA_04592 [Thraustotheca clavata]|uniref:ARID domain-containing protein n=1 Tax=Thraustotheca clavata TaxID=74557 RepID=A0A1V9ZYQ4_9STRA|nr:hypothetical protein THRCLA_04592 [Thraustotheca clavata]